LQNLQQLTPDGKRKPTPVTAEVILR